MSVGLKEGIGTNRCRSISLWTGPGFDFWQRWVFCLSHADLQRDQSISWWGSVTFPWPVWQRRRLEVKSCSPTDTKCRMNRYTDCQSHLFFIQVSKTCYMFRSSHKVIMRDKHPKYEKQALYIQKHYLKGTNIVIAYNFNVCAWCIDSCAAVLGRAVFRCVLCTVEKLTSSFFFFYWKEVPFSPVNRLWSQLHI